LLEDIHDQYQDLNKKKPLAIEFGADGELLIALQFYLPPAPRTRTHIVAPLGALPPSERGTDTLFPAATIDDLRTHAASEYPHVRASAAVLLRVAELGRITEAAREMGYTYDQVWRLAKGVRRDGADYVRRGFLVRFSAETLTRIREIAEEWDRPELRDAAALLLQAHERGRISGVAARGRPYNELRTLAIGVMQHGADHLVRRFASVRLAPEVAARVREIAESTEDELTREAANLTLKALELSSIARAVEGTPHHYNYVYCLIRGILRDGPDHLVRRFLGPVPPHVVPRLREIAHIARRPESREAAALLVKASETRSIVRALEGSSRSYNWVYYRLSEVMKRGPDVLLRPGRWER
jgi:hypothetical protein